MFPAYTHISNLQPLIVDEYLFPTCVTSTVSSDSMGLYVEDVTIKDVTAAGVGPEVTREQKHLPSCSARRVCGLPSKSRDEHGCTHPITIVILD
jgi:hypothetical protein